MNYVAKKMDDYVVAQHNALIEANYPAGLSVRANKIIRLIFSLIKPNEENLREHTIGIKTVKKYLGYNLSDSHGRFNADLKDISKRLNKEPIEINTGDKKILTAYFISSYEIDHLNQTVTFEISGKLRPYLLHLKKNYTSYFLSNIPKLKSSYSIRIYELLIQYKKIGIRVFALDDLQNKVGAKDQTAYELYSNFKNRVLKKSQKDLEKYTDIRFEFDEIKTGRKVTSLKFYILPNKPKKKEDTQALLPFLEPELIAEEENNNVSETIISRLAQKGINQKTIEIFILKGFNAIENEEKRQEAKERCGTIEIYFVEKLTLLEQQKDKQKNPAGFLVRAIKEDWLSKKLIDDTKEVDAKKKIAAKNRKIHTLKYRLNELEQKERKAEKAVLDKLLSDNDIFLNAFNPTMEELSTNKFFQENYYQNIKNLPPLEQYKKTSFISVSVNNKLKDSYPEKFEQILLLEKTISGIKKELERLEASY